MAFFIGIDASEIDPVSGTDAGRRQGFGKHACCCLSGFAHAGAKPGRFPPPPPPIQEVTRRGGLLYWYSNSNQHDGEATARVGFDVPLMIFHAAYQQFLHQFAGK
jgi:hypothetical protein